MTLRADGIGHEITRRFPAHQIPSWDGPGRAGQIAMTGEKFKVDGRPKKRVAIHPFFHARKFLDRRFASEKEILRLQIEPLHHVFLGRVIIVTRGYGVAVDAEIGQKIEHLLNLIHVGLFIYGRVGRDLIAKAFRHFNGKNAFLEDAFALNDQIVRPLESVEVHVPVHPFAWTDNAIADCGLRVADCGGVLFRKQPVPK